MTKSKPSLEGLQDSPYAAELRKDPLAARFAPAVEADYLRAFLAENRALVRMSCTLAVLVVVMRALEVALGGATADSGPVFGAVLTISAALAWLAWGRGYERHYVPWAQLLIPVRNCIIAAQLVRVAAQGQLDVLMLLPLILIGPFYFMGLRFRAALPVVLLSAVSMLAAAVEFRLPEHLVLDIGAFSVLAIATFAVAAQHIEKRSRRAFLESRLVAELAQHDVLTWTKNRRMLDEYLPRLWHQAAEDGRALAVLLIDVDHFKPFNDRYGHQAGDAALRKVAQTLQPCARRPLDLVARYGGEEFTVVLYDTDRGRAAATAEQIRKSVETLAIEHRGSRTGTVLTVSIGVAVVCPDRARSAQGALQLADSALYRAKSNGRNRVEIMDQAEHHLLVTGVFPQALADTLKRIGAKH
jgi:diguanylate cyclase (GGDEF)-like protein